MDNLTKLPDFTRAGRAYEAVGLQDGHPIVDITHDDELSVGCCDIGAGAVPVHVQKSHLQGLFTKELQTHLLILQDLLHCHQSVARLLLLCQLSHTPQDHKVTLAEAVDHLASRFTQLAVVVLWKWTHLLAGLSGLKVVLVATTASVHKGLALFEAGAISPARFIGLARPLEAW